MDVGDKKNEVELKVVEEKLDKVKVDLGGEEKEGLTRAHARGEAVLFGAHES